MRCCWSEVVGFCTARLPCRQRVAPLMRLNATINDPLNPLKALLESRYEIEKFAEAHPQSFWNRYLGSRIWFSGFPWYKPRYNQVIDWVVISRFPGANYSVLAHSYHCETGQTCLSQICWAKCRFKSVSCLSASAWIKVVASEEATSVLNYLLADPRRLSLGSQMGSDRHRETEKLIAVICPSCNQRIESNLSRQFGSLPTGTPRG